MPTNFPMLLYFSYKYRSMLNFSNKLKITVFLTGAAILVVEILGSRILAPYFGSSLLVWTSIIGVILAAMSLGYYVGGRMADQNPKVEQLALVIFLAGAFTLVLPMLSPFSMYLPTIFGITAGSLLASIALFSVPSFLLGIVSPYAVKLNTSSLSNVGSSAGSLYAISTVGSIAGAFTTGFYLIPLFGIKTILLFTSIILFMLPALLLGKKILPFAVSAALLTIFISFIPSTTATENSVTIYEADSAYYHIRVVDSQIDKTRFLFLDRQSAAYVSLSSDQIVFNYINLTIPVYRLKSNAKNILFLGLGGGIEPMYFRSLNKTTNIRIVEIDSALPDVSKDYFGFQTDDRMKVFIEDARTFLMRSEEKYDLIRVDAFNSYDSVPIHLTTTELLQLLKQRLEDNGIVVTHVQSGLEGRGSAFFRSEYKTYKQNFKYVVVISTDPQKPQAFQSIVLIGSDSADVTGEKILSMVANDDAIRLAVLSGLWKHEIKTDDVPVLSDDYAPVESMLAAMH